MLLSIMTIINTVQLYLQTLFDIPVTTKESSLSLPLIITGTYNLQTVLLCKQELILITPKQESHPTPVTLKKHIQYIERKSQLQVIFASMTITPYLRQRLIEEKLPFIIPNTQIYLPFLGIALQERFPIKKESIKSVQIPTQCIILHLFYNHQNIEYTPTLLSNMLGYSAMSMSRGFDELEQFDSITIQKKGRKRFLSLTAPKKESWAEISPFLVSPVQKTYVVQEALLPKGYTSGLNALSHFSLLSEPEYLTIAVAKSKFITPNTSYPIEYVVEDGFGKIEAWKYSPLRFSLNDIVDPLSLYCLLRDEEDERVQLCVEEMMDRIKW